MIDRIGHIKNPLTIIAMFAAIAEASGTIVLPFISSNNQTIYIWFLMFFPVMLVLIFFLTLNFNHKALYAPSDWKDESNFFRRFTDATPEEMKKKLKDETYDAAEETETTKTKPSGIEPEITSLSRNTAHTIKTDIEKRKIERIAKYRDAEKLAINKLSFELNLAFRQDVKFQVSQSRRIIFDAVSIGKDRVDAVEVKLLYNDALINPLIDRIFLETENVAKTIRESGKDFVLHYVAVLENTDIDRASIETKLRKYTNKYDINIKLHIFTMSELQSTQQNSI